MQPEKRPASPHCPYKADKIVISTNTAVYVFY